MSLFNIDHIILLCVLSNLFIFITFLPHSIYSGFQISIILWGERAIAFEGESLLQSAEKEPVVAIFVGTLVKPYEGQHFTGSRSNISASFT